MEDAVAICDYLPELQHFPKLPKKIIAVVRAGRGLGMILHAESRRVLMSHGFCRCPSSFYEILPFDTQLTYRGANRTQFQVFAAPNPEARSPVVLTD